MDQKSAKGPNSMTEALYHLFYLAARGAEQPPIKE